MTRGRAKTDEAEKARRQKISRAMKKRVRIGAYRDERGRFISQEQWYAMREREKARREVVTPEPISAVGGEPTPGRPGQRKVLVIAGYRLDGTQRYVSAEEHIMWIDPLENNPEDLRRLLNAAHPGRVYFDDKTARKEQRQARQPRVVEWL
jgi:hypothetical protein